MTDLSLSRSQMLLLSGSANRALAEEVAAHLGQPLCQVTLRRFADGELFVKIDENVRGRDVYIVQPTNPPAENMIELLLLMDAAKRASAARVTAVIPYFGYARQDRKDQPRVPITAKLVANLLVAAGASFLEPLLLACLWQGPGPAGPAPGCGTRAPAPDYATQLELGPNPYATSPSVRSARGRGCGRHGVRRR